MTLCEHCGTELQALSHVSPARWELDDTPHDAARCRDILRAQVEAMRTALETIANRTRRLDMGQYIAVQALAAMPKREGKAGT